MSKLNDEDVRHLAHLANLDVSDKELPSLAKQLDETIRYMDNLKELDTSHVKGVVLQKGQVNVTFEDGVKNTRHLTETEALENSKHIQSDYFVVSRIL